MKLTIKTKFSNDNIDKSISIALMSPFVILTMQYLVLKGLNLTNTLIGSQIQNFSILIVGLMYIIALPKVMQRNLKVIVYTYIISLFIFLLHYILFTDNQLIMQSSFFSFFFMSMPSFIYAFSLRDFTVFKKIMEYTSYIVFAIGIILALFVFTNRVDLETYSMPLSYYMLLPAIVFIDKIFDRFSLKTLILIFLSIMIILSLGARGPFIGIFTFIPLKLIKTNILKNSFYLVKFIILGIFAILIVVFIDDILVDINNFLLNYGVQSRSILAFLNSGLETSGRDIIYRLGIEKIMVKPIFGWGLFGDRIALNGIDYVHNFYLEILFHFGILFGFILLLFLLSTIAISIIKSKSITYNLIIIWISLGFSHLIVSGSYLIDIKFWIFLGLLINVVFLKPTAHGEVRR